MAMCSQCGKKGIFVKVNDVGICNDCQTAAENKAREKQIAKAAEIAEKKRLEDEHKKSISKNSVNFPARTPELTLAYHYSDVDLYIDPNSKPDFNRLHTLQLLGQEFELAQEPDNEHDKDAVVVKADTVTIGYLYRDKLQDMANDYIRRGDYVVACISMLDKMDKKVQVALGFYKVKKSKDLESEVQKSFKLMGNLNAEMQSNIGVCSEEDKVNFDYDDEKEKYVAKSVLEIGYVPKSAEQIVENCLSASIEKIELNDNLKYVVTVSIWYNKNDI